MSSSLTVAVAGSEVAELAEQLDRSGSDITLVRSCETLVEAAAVCESGLARVLVTSGSASDELSMDIVARLYRARCLVVAIVRDGAESALAQAKGAWTLPASAAAGDLRALLSQAGLIETARDGGELRRGDSASGVAMAGRAVDSMGFEARGHHNAVGNSGVPPERQRPSGRVMALWGPTGATGRTTVGINLAAELSLLGSSVLLIDADTYGASVAASLGLLDESAGLAQASRAADQGTLDSKTLHRLCAVVPISGGAFSVLTGITRPDRWPELRPAPLKEVISVASGMYDAVVIDCSFCIEEDEELSFDGYAPRRNAATTVSLKAADEIFVIGAADAVGVPRLIRALAQLDELVPQAHCRVVMNKVRPSAVGRDPRGALQHAWSRFGPKVGIDEFLPWDSESLDVALLSGRTLAEAAARSELRLAIRQMISELAPTSASQKGRTRRRGSVARRRRGTNFPPASQLSDSSTFSRRGASPN